MNYLKSKRQKTILFIIAIFFIYIVTSLILDFDLLFFLSMPKGFANIYDRYFNPSFKEVTIPSRLLTETISTILLSAAATMVGAIFAFILVIFTQRDTKYNFPYKFTVIFGSIFRNIPPYLWALMLLFFMWYGTFVAFLALAIGTMGFLIKTFLEVFDEQGKEKIDALKSMGASPLQIVFKGLVPDSLPSMTSWFLYAFEVNVRSATLVGMITSGGLGYILEITRGLSFIDHPEKYQMQMAVILTITALVIIINVLVTKVRRRLV